MIDQPITPRTAFRAVGRTMLCALLVCAVGVVVAPPVQAQVPTPQTAQAFGLPHAPALNPADASSSAQSVPIDQQPLTIAKPLPPNIVLMLDDSGSMQWDVMPDWDNLSSRSDLAVIDSAVNGVYYNPSVTYKPPPKADGTSSWPDASFDSAPVNGFYTDNERHEVDLTTYDGGYDSSTATGRDDGYPSGSSNLQYSVRIADVGAYDAPKNCPNGTHNSGSQDEYCYYSHNPSPKFYEFRERVNGSTTYYVSKCNKEGVTYNKSTNKCIDSNKIEIANDDHSWSCPSGTTSIGKTTVDYNDDRAICTSSSHNFFTYATNGVRHYVGKSGECAAAGLSADVCVDPSQATPTDSTVAADMSGADVLQNVANWFAYYHTRMLMAKSSLMNAFSGLDKNYRLGFGSLHNNGGFPDKMSTHKYSGYRLALVHPFGDGSNKSDHKTKFWNWVLDQYPHNGTPLRESLEAIGQYYETSQPWQTSANDSTELACRQSYAILTTDGFWNGSDPSDVDAGTTDKDGPKYTDSKGNKVGYTAAPPYSGGQATTTDWWGNENSIPSLADVATYYWENDLQPKISNEVPVSGNADPAFWQHMTTFTIGMGFVPTGIQPTGTTAEQIFDWARNGGTPSDFRWPTPSSDDINNIADLLHAGVNGHGGFYSATSPQAFTEGLQDALKRIAARKGSGASLSASSSTVGTDTDAYAYQSMYHTGDWSGSLYAYALDDNGDPADEPSWSAETQMPAPDDRNIHTYNPDKSDNGGDVTFTYDNLSDAEKTALGDDTDRQQKMVQYLRGALIQGDDWRARLTLGDIVDSQPIYVGAPDPDLYSDPSLNFDGSSGYEEDAEDKKDVSPILYVAANDGMLHGFYAGTEKTDDWNPGQETYAFLPQAVILHGSETGNHTISQIADPNYGYQNGGVPHQYFNDGQLTVADVYMDDSWKAILVGTTGRGHAKAIYALDVTDPKDVKLLWEKSAYTDGCDNCSYIGQMTSKPIIAQVANGEWAVLMGNGYNSEKNTAALLQFSLSNGSLTVHTTDTETDNGLSGPAIWIADSTNNISTTAYAGDIKGRVWSFTLNNGDNATPNTDGVMLFTTKNNQPITSALAVQKDQSTGKLWVFFGTGKYLTSDDKDEDATQTWYGLIVADKNGTRVAAGNDSKLAERDIYTGTDGDGNPVRAVSDANEVDPVSGEKNDGWYIDLPMTGERMIVDSRFHGSLLYGTSIIPTVTDVCNPSGSGWVMAINPFTGTNPDWKVFGSSMKDADGKTRNTGGIHFGSMPNAPIFVRAKNADDGSHMLTSTWSGDMKETDVSPPAGGGLKAERISWREVVSD